MRASAPEVRLSPTVHVELPWVSRIRLFKSVKSRDFKKRASAAKQAAEKLGFVSGHDFSRAVND
jgi:hypothetical protein